MIERSMLRSKPQTQPAAAQQKQMRPQLMQQLLQLTEGFLSILLWCFASSALIVMNNNLYKSGFPYPLMVTGLTQMFTAITGLLLSCTGISRLTRGPPTSPQEIIRLLPLVGCTATSLFLGNAPYMYLSLSFIQILKAFLPALTLVVGVLAGVEKLTGVLMMSVLLIALGTGGSVLAESSTPTYSLYGLMLFLGSGVADSGRVVASQLLLGQYRYSNADVLVYAGIPTAITLISSSILYESQHGMLQALKTLIETKPWVLVQAGLMSGLVNFTSYLAISTTSSLTFKVSGCLKNLAVVWYGVATHGDVVTLQHMLGYAVSLAGFTLFSYSRQYKAKAS